MVNWEMLTLRQKLAATRFVKIFQRLAPQLKKLKEMNALTYEEYTTIARDLRSVDDYLALMDWIPEERKVRLE